MIRDRNVPEKIGPPLFDVVTGIPGHFLPFERHESLHDSVRSIMLTKFPECCCHTGMSFFIDPDDSHKTIDRISELVFEIRSKRKCEETRMRRESVELAGANGGGERPNSIGLVPRRAQGKDME